MTKLLKQIFNPSGAYCLLSILLLSPLLLVAQVEETIKVSGVVVDNNNNPLPGVNIRIKNSSVGTVTNAQGNFGIAIKKGQEKTLQFSFVSFKTQSLNFESTTENVIVVMEEDIQALSEVVVTAYNQKKTKTELVGSVATIDTKKLEPFRPEASFENLLSGKIAGVNIVNQSGGDPGRPISVRIRGEGSLPRFGQNTRTSSSEPLYILDGVPLYDIQQEQFSQVAGRSDIMNPLSTLEPADIESISILKDASAAAIYGADAANGVVIITTKKGKKGANINLSFNQGVGHVINPRELLDGNQYVELRREVLMNDDNDLSFEEAVREVPDAAFNTDWFDLLFKPSTFSKFYASIANGGDNYDARLSANYTKQSTVTEGNDFTKFGFRSNLGFNFGEKFTIRINSALNAQIKDMVGAANDIYSLPNLSPYNNDGSFNNSGFFERQPNPLAVLEQNENSNQVFNTINNISLAYDILQGLSLEGLAGLTYDQKKQVIFRSAQNATGLNQNGSLDDIFNQNLQWVANLRLSYQKTYARKHSTNFLLGTEARNKTTTILRGSATNFLYEFPRVLQASAEREDRNASSSLEENSTLSYFGEASYSFDRKYFLSFNARSDASSLFGGDVQRALFGSVGTSWIINREAFFNSDVINLLKVKASFGSTGNSRIGNYASRGLYTIDNRYFYNGDLGFIPETPENQNLTWEKNFKTNIGLDVAFSNSLSILVEYYRNNIIDAISSISIPHETGFSSGNLNAVNMRNSGIEFTVSYDWLKGNNWNWNSSFNATTNQNIVTDIRTSDNFIVANSLGVGYEVGRDISTIFGTPFVGVDPATGNALYRLADGSITDSTRLATRLENRQVIGNRNPKLFGGFTNQLSWKNFSLSIVASYSFGSQILINGFNEQNGRQLALRNQSVNLIKRWQNEGDVTNIPKLSNEVDNFTSLSSQYLYDLDYIKIENISLSYRLNPDLLAKTPIKNLDISLQCNTVGYFYFDDKNRELNGVAEYRFIFPESRIYMLGMNVNL